jgi:hypothetical protein
VPVALMFCCISVSKDGKWIANAMGELGQSEGVECVGPQKGGPVQLGAQYIEAGVRDRHLAS